MGMQRTNQIYFDEPAKARKPSNETYEVKSNHEDSMLTGIGIGKTGQNTLTWKKTKNLTPKSGGNP